MRDEQWKSVLGHEGYYEVSDKGRVRSLGRMANRGRGGWRWMDGQVLQLNLTNGRHMVALSVNGVARRCNVGPLVLEAFVGPRPQGMECCHWDDVSTNDVLGNLRWDTPKNNKADQLRNGRNHHAIKIQCPREHDLFPPNLVSDAGERSCRACSMAKSWARRNGISLDDPRWVEEADRRYAEIMAGQPGRNNRDKTVCKLEHKLRAPNLVNLASGSRACLACGRTSSWARYRKIPRTDHRWKAEAARRYAEIMA